MIYYASVVQYLILVVSVH